jgi:subtilisin family serine protease
MSARPRPLRRPRAALPERLEPRAMLSADLAANAPSWRDIAWNGELVRARTDAWIVVADGSDRAPAVRSGWTTTGLGAGYYSVLAPGASAAEVAEWAVGAGVGSLEPDRIVSRAALPNDPSFSRLWGLNNTGQTSGVADADIDAVEAWDTTTGSRSVVVAVVDTGIDYRHVDLAGNMWRNPGEVAGDRIDNDGNGFVDDVFGWDFANNDADPFDDEGHGTHVAGTIGAVGNNGTGVVGVSWNVSLMALKFLGADGSGTTSAAIAALNYATRMRRDFGVNVVATNNSWGGGGASTALRSAITAGESAGIVCVAAAGNESTNNDSTAAYPAQYATLAVAATDASNRLASFSNWGATTVDVAAPGVGIYSTLPGNSYGSYSGTSMATPHVAGIVALMAAANPAATVAEIRDAMIATAVPVSTLAGKVAAGGLVNARAAVTAVAVPTDPSDPSDPGEPVDPGDPTDPGGPPAVEADVVDVAPDPRTTSVSAVVVQFSRAVTGFDVDDLALTRDGVDVPLSVSLTTTDGIRWTVSGLSEETATSGSYVLTVSAAGGISAEDDGGLLAVAAKDSWVTRAATLVDAGDTLTRAAVLASTSGEVRLAGRIGDGLYGRRDVDLYRVRLAAGQSLTVDIDAESLPGGSTLDSYLRVFSSTGRQLAFNDDASGSLDSFLSFRAAVAGTYYVGISGYGNGSYSPTRAPSGRNGSIGDYRVLFALSPTPGGRTGARAAGSRDSSVPVTESAFAMYGANWEAAVTAVNHSRSVRGPKARCY